jgi:competence protein ComEA
MRRVVIVLCAVLLCVPVILKSRTNQELPDRAAFRVYSSGNIVVKVSGDVRHAGIYEVPANTMAVTVIKMAIPGHPLKPFNAGEAASRQVQNGAALQFSDRGDGSQLITFGQMSVAERLVLNIPLDISAMNEADFDRLPGIGPALARRIVEYSQNNDKILQVEDLALIEGIGEKKFKALSRYFQHTENTH